MKNPAVGDTVLFVLTTLAVAPAMVTRVVGDRVNLHVFPDKRPAFSASQILFVENPTALQAQQCAMPLPEGDLEVKLPESDAPESDAPEQVEMQLDTPDSEYETPIDPGAEAEAESEAEPEKATGN